MKLDVNTDWEDFEELPSKQKLKKKNNKVLDSEKPDREKKSTHRRRRESDENIR
jgi:hypothetical protein